MFSAQNVHNTDCLFKTADVEESEILESLKARAILIDMEENVIKRTLNGPLRNLFDSTQIITDVSGSGNNWAMAHKIYGPKHRDKIISLFHKEAERCEYLQCFYLLHSISGGTGSGLGTAVLQYLAEEFPKIPRFVGSLFPAKDDDVIIAPYNSVLAISKLKEFASCVIPFGNDALTKICLEGSTGKFYRRFRSNLPASSTLTTVGGTNCFGPINNLVANTIINLTCSSRFTGPLNIDVTDLLTNMVPFPSLNYLIPSLFPLFSSDANCNMEQIFYNLFKDNHQLFESPVRDGFLLTGALICRGQISVSDVQRNIDRVKKTLKCCPWNEEIWKIGVCDVPHFSCPISFLMLANTSCISSSLLRLKVKFLKMFKKRCYLHHFLKFDDMSHDAFTTSLDDLTSVIKGYEDVGLNIPAQDNVPFRVLI